MYFLYRVTIFSTQTSQRMGSLFRRLSPYSRPTWNTNSRSSPCTENQQHFLSVQKTNCRFSLNRIIGVTSQKTSRRSSLSRRPVKCLLWKVLFILKAFIEDQHKVYPTGLFYKDINIGSSLYREDQQKIFSIQNNCPIQKTKRRSSLCGWL